MLFAEMAAFKLTVQLGVITSTRKFGYLQFAKNLCVPKSGATIMADMVNRSTKKDRMHLKT